jgi:predicted dehydrogenase
MLRVGVIGTGDIAKKSYLPGMNDSERGIELTAVCDIVPSRADAMAKEFGAGEVFYDHREMLQKADLDLIVVLTPVATHAPFVRDALLSGRHVYSEKPFAMTREGADELCELAERQNRLLMAAPLLMLYPEYQLLRKTVRGGATGKVTFARAHSSHGGANRGMWATDSGNFFRTDTAGPMPPLFDMGVYALTLLTDCLGSVKRVSAFAGVGVPERRIQHVAEEGFVPYTLKAEAPDNLGLLLDFGDGCIATIDASFCLPYKKGPQYEFYGYEGAVYFGMEAGSLEVISERPEFAAPNAEKPVAWHPHPALSEGKPEGEKPKWGQAMTRHVAECLATGRRPLMPGEHARHVVEIMERAADSARTGRAQEMSSEASPTLD